MLLILVAAAAILIANSPLRGAYEALFHGPLPWTPIAELDSLHLWINDAAMAVFFFVVGLEVKREVVTGSLADPRARRLPLLAAFAGMGVPALCYLAVTGTGAAGMGPLGRGWAVPAATDIAFAMGIIGLLGARVPPSLRLFLLSVAIIDDLGAIAIIALFYTASIALGWLIGALVMLAGLIALNRSGERRGWLYLPLALVLWFCMLHSGIHATIAGVAAALTIPLAADAHGRSLLARLEHALEPWSNRLIVPLFGFANAGVVLGGAGDGMSVGNGGARDAATLLPWAIAIGLFAGKQVGVLGAIALADRLRIAPRPAGASWPQLWGTAALCGIGFTMSLFIGALAFSQYPDLYEHAKLGVLGGSLASMVLGYAILRFARGPRFDDAQPAERIIATNASP